MKMQNTEMEFVAFDAADIIATSGDPYAGEDKNDPDYAKLYYFYGLGSDRTAPNKEGLQIRNQGEDVTDRYLDQGSYMLRTTLGTNTYTCNLTSDDGVEGTLSSELERIYHLGDGAYKLASGSKTSYFDYQQ